MKYPSLFSISLIFLIALLFISCENDWNSVSTESGNELITDSEMAVPQGKVIFVAPPTGDFQTDRASVKAAVAQTEPGDIVQFAAGTYVIGSDVPWDGIVVDVPGITLQGHPDGTTLKGGDNITMAGQYLGFTLTGGHQTVRGLTFDSFAWTVLYLNSSLYSEKGGYRIEHNTFRNSTIGIMYQGQSEEISNIQHNVFDNIGAATWVYGKTCYFKWNKVIASDPYKVPVWGYPATVGGVSAWYTPCDNNIFAHNILDGISDGIILAVAFAESDEASCNNNLIIGNKFLHQEIYTEDDLGTMVMLFSTPGKSFEDNRILNNTYLGSGGIGIYSEGGSNTTFANNKIKGAREYSPSFWQTGIGIYLDENSDRNRLEKNKFHDNDLYDIALYGDYNTVITSSRNDNVLDNGEGNQVLGRGLRKLGQKNVDMAIPVAETAKKKREMIKELMQHIVKKSEKNTR